MPSADPPDLRGAAYGIAELLRICLAGDRATIEIDGMFTIVLILNRDVNGNVRTRLHVLRRPIERADQISIGVPRFGRVMAP